MRSNRLALLGDARARGQRVLTVVVDIGQERAALPGLQLCQGRQQVLAEVAGAEGRRNQTQAQIGLLQGRVVARLPQERGPSQRQRFTEVCTHVASATKVEQPQPTIGHEQVVAGVWVGLQSAQCKGAVHEQVEQQLAHVIALGLAGLRLQPLVEVQPG